MDPFLLKRIGIIVVAVLCAAFIIMVSVIGIRTLNGDDARFGNTTTTELITTSSTTSDFSSTSYTQSITEISEETSTTKKTEADSSKTQQSGKKQNHKSTYNEPETTSQTNARPEPQQSTTEKTISSAMKDLQPQIDGLKQELAEEKKKISEKFTGTDLMSDENKNTLLKIDECNRRIEVLESQIHKPVYSDDEYKKALAEIESIKTAITEIQNRIENN